VHGEKESGDLNGTAMPSLEPPRICLCPSVWVMAKTRLVQNLLLFALDLCGFVASASTSLSESSLLSSSFRAASSLVIYCSSLFLLDSTSRATPSKPPFPGVFTRLLQAPQPPFHTACLVFLPCPLGAVVGHLVPYCHGFVLLDVLLCGSCLCIPHTGPNVSGRPTERWTAPELRRGDLPGLRQLWVAIAQCVTLAGATQYPSLGDAW